MSVPANGDTFDPLGMSIEPDDSASDPSEAGFAVEIVQDLDEIAFRIGPKVLQDRAWQQFFQGHEKVEARFDGRRLRLKAVVDEDGLR